jgi:hypothetical protein
VSFPQPSKRAFALLVSEFTRDGKKAAYSATHTSQGTLPLWGQLVLAGLVVPTTKIFHQFAYQITKKGEEFIELGHPKLCANCGRIIVPEQSNPTSRGRKACVECVAVSFKEVVA